MQLLNETNTHIAPYCLTLPEVNKKAWITGTDTIIEFWSQKSLFWPLSLCWVPLKDMSHWEQMITHQRVCWTSVCLGLDHSASSFPSENSSQGHSDASRPRAALLEGLISVNTYQQEWIIRICVLRIDCCFELATMVQKLMTFLYQNNRSFLFPLFAETLNKTGMAFS